MTYTRFGELVRILRVEHREVMGDLAIVLGVKVPFLSAVENGKKNVPADWIERIAVHYGLSATEKAELAEAAEESRTQYKINAERSGIPQRRAALSFARSFDQYTAVPAQTRLSIAQAECRISIMFSSSACRRPPFVMRLLNCYCIYCMSHISACQQRYVIHLQEKTG